MQKISVEKRWFHNVVRSGWNLSVGWDRANMSGELITGLKPILFIYYVREP